MSDKSSERVVYVFNQKDTGEGLSYVGVSIEEAIETMKKDAGELSYQTLKIFRLNCKGNLEITLQDFYQGRRSINVPQKTTILFKPEIEALIKFLDENN